MKENSCINKGDLSSNPSMFKCLGSCDLLWNKPSTFMHKRTNRKALKPQHLFTHTTGCRFQSLPTYRVSTAHHTQTNVGLDCEQQAFYLSALRPVCLSVICARSRFTNQLPSPLVSYSYEIMDPDLHFQPKVFHWEAQPTAQQRERSQLCFCYGLRSSSSLNKTEEAPL